MIDEWARRWDISQAALEDLVRRSAPLGPALLPGKSEAAVQAHVRMLASQRGWRLFRNNVGATTDDRGNFIRYGLCNESAAQNKQFKSADLIGIRPRVIDEHDVGTTIGQFAAVETKHGDWKPDNSPRTVAQSQFISLVRKFGGYATFSTGTLP